MPVDSTFWAEESESLMVLLFDHFKKASDEAQRSGVHLVEEMAGVPIGVDWDFANENAIQWAIEQSARTAAYVTSTSMEAFQSKFPEWASSGAPMEDLIAELEPYYGKSRAAAVAVTETTNAFAKGNMMGWEATGVVDKYDFMIAEDELVCPICHGARDKSPYNLDDVDNAPALHVYCRCWLQPRVNMGAVATQGTTELSSDLEEMLKTSPYESADDIDREKGFFESERVHIEGDGYAIRKPAPEEGTFGAGNLSKNEALAYEIDKRLGLRVVPKTVYRAEEDASFQAFVENARPAMTAPTKVTDYATGKHVPAVADPEEFGHMSLLDGVLGNSDRHEGNFLITNDRHVIGIDHGLSVWYEGSGPGRFMSPPYHHAEAFAGYYEPDFRLPLPIKYRNTLREAIDDGSLSKLMGKYDIGQERIDGVIGRAESIYNDWTKYYVEP